ncbi:membrane protein insertase YidC [Massilia sp. TWP1-3-3]|uniref:membrane protein insertase YidC n=2 Tax=unclassified Massilia TaxID=2609279 RepID=UPI003CF29E9A
MDINKRTILWIVFSVSLVFLWNNWMVANGNQSMFSMTSPPAQVAQAPVAVNPAAGVPAATGAAAAVPGAPMAPPAIKTEIITITTDVFKVDIDTAGGVVKRLELLKFRDKVDKTKNQVLFDVTPKGAYIGKTGLLLTGAALPNESTPFVAKPGPRALDSANEVQLVLEGEAGGVKLIKTFTFKRGEYVIGMRHDVTNTTANPVSPSLYLKLQHHGNKPEGESYFTSSYTGPTMYTPENKYEKLKFEDIEKKGTAAHTQSSTGGWIAISQHYFVSAFLPPEGLQRDTFTRKTQGVSNLYEIESVMPLGAIAPGATKSADVRMYSGPQDENKLEKIAPGLELVKDYGMLTVLAKPIFWVMDQIHTYLGNWGWTIIAFTILIKLLFFPLSAAGYKSMARIKVVTPKMTAIREKYKGDPAKMNQATMELYKTEKINPLGGCLPILVQMPVFIALYWVLQASAEMRGAPWVGWIQDLTAPDPYFILPVLYAISMFITTKLNPAPADPMQAKMMLFMPLIFSVMFVFFPSGLVLYWVVNNILSIAQQYVITKKFEVAATTVKK